MKISKSKLKEHFSQEKARLKEMTFKEKLEHIWTYYKEYMFVALMVILVVVIVLSAVLNQDLEFYACGNMSNVELSREGHKYLTDVFFEDVLGNPEGKIYLTTSTLKGSSTVDATNDTFSTTMGILSQVEGKDLDYMLMDPYSFEHYVDERIYMDLNTLLSQEELDQLYAQGMIVNIRADVETEGTAAGIDLSKTQFGKDCLLTEGTVYLVFIRNTEHPDHCLKLWEHIKNWK